MGDAKVALAEIVAQARWLLQHDHDAMLALKICGRIANLARDVDLDDEYVGFIGVDSESDGFMLAAGAELLSPEFDAQRRAAAADYWGRIRDGVLADATRIVERLGGPPTPEGLLDLLVGRAVTAVVLHDFQPGISFQLPGALLVVYVPFCLEDGDGRGLEPERFVGAVVSSHGIVGGWLVLGFDRGHRLLIDLHKESMFGPEILQLQLDGHISIWGESEAVT
jgi:hypothetical protein